MDISSRIKTIQEHYELSASSFADTLGVQRSSISHILSGRNKPSLDFVLKIVTNFDEVDLNWILLNKGFFPKSRLSNKKTPSENLFDSAPASEQDNLTVTSKNSPETLNKPLSNSAENVINSYGDSKKEIHKILVLYKDGSFDAYER